MTAFRSLLFKSYLDCVSVSGKSFLFGNAYDIVLCVKKSLLGVVNEL